MFTLAEYAGGPYKYVRAMLPHVGECWVDVISRKKGRKGKRFAVAITYEQAKRLIKELQDFIEMYDEIMKKRAMEKMVYMFKEIDNIPDDWWW